MAGGPKPVEAAVHDLAGEVAERQNGWIEHLVDMEIDAEAGVGGGVDHDADEACSIVVEVGATTDMVDPGFDRLGERSAGRGSLRAGHRAPAEGDELDVEQAFEPIGRLPHRPHRGGADDVGDVDVGPDRGATVD